MTSFLVECVVADSIHKFTAGCEDDVEWEYVDVDTETAFEAEMMVRNTRKDLVVIDVYDEHRRITE